MAKKQEMLKVRNLRSPHQIMMFAKTLKAFIKDSGLYTVIQGNEYANVDGWKFAGLNFGVVPIVDEPEKISKDGQLAIILFRKEQRTYNNKQVTVDAPFFASINEARAKEFEQSKKVSKKNIVDYYSYKCGCKIINQATGKQVGSGFATCSNLELKKVSFDEYAIASMAQTRAIGKAFRNLMGFVMKSAGYEPTPAEEMAEESLTDKDKADGKVNPEAKDIDQIKEALSLLNTRKELARYYNGLSATLQSNKDIISAFKIRTTQIKKNESKREI